MLISINELRGYHLCARDCQLGKIHDCYFDDGDWKVRYFVIETGSWLTGRERVLISPHSVLRIDHQKHTIDVALTREQVRNAPPIDTAMPVSRAAEAEAAAYYDWPSYWNFEMPPPMPPPVSGTGAAPLIAPLAEEEAGPHLRSAKEVKGYRTGALDAPIGHIDDFLAEERDWAIRYLVVDTRDILPGKKVVLPRWLVQLVSWNDQAVYVDAPKETIKGAPPYEGPDAVTPDYERTLDRHYRSRG